MMQNRGDLAMIKVELQNRCESVCRALLPHGRVEGRLYVAHDPVLGDYDRKPALKVRLTGNVGGWQSFRGGADGAKKDILGLVAYIQRTDVKGALAWSRDFLGIRSMTWQERADMRRAAAVQAQKQAARERKNRQWKIGRAQELFQKNTIEIMQAYHAQAYFAAREIPLSDVQGLPKQSFRFSAGTEWWRGAVYKTDDSGRRYKVQAGPRFPAVHAAVRGPCGQQTACHVTYLDPLLPAKAPVEPAKLVFGEVTGGIIEVATGPSGIGFWQAKEPDMLILCEGVETALSLAIAVPEARVWAGVSITNMANAPVGLNCVGDIILARDNNWGNATAQKQIATVIDRLEAAGKPLAVMSSHVGDDFNDLMKGTDHE